MAKLSAAQRRVMPPGDFALGKGHYPIEDKGHAMAALSRISEFGSSSEQATVRRKVKAKYPSMHVEAPKPGR